MSMSISHLFVIHEPSHLFVIYEPSHCLHFNRFKIYQFFLFTVVNTNFMKFSGNVCKNLISSLINHIIFYRNR